MDKKETTEFCPLSYNPLLVSRHSAPLPSSGEPQNCRSEASPGWCFCTFKHLGAFTHGSEKADFSQRQRRVNVSLRTIGKNWHSKYGGKINLRDSEAHSTLKQPLNLQSWFFFVLPWISNWSKIPVAQFGDSDNLSVNSEFTMFTVSITNIRDWGVVEYL